ncbi:hypothetical protein CTI12_AA614460 [Artemisia annua]|uniref:Secreted protein n=1 Tax=Artemisia annua TaxID=35608 RepID=A0A2U1KDU3_ARTAN|nr:hypothetical protein CTI12_AA614460 [Artemisia annua]
MNVWQSALVTVVAMLVDLSSLEVICFSLSTKQDFEDPEGSCELEDTAIQDLPLPARNLILWLPSSPITRFHVKEIFLKCIDSRESFESSS